MAKLGVDGENVVTFVIGVGDTIRLTAPQGYPPVTFGEDANAEQYKNGFEVLDTDLGVFTSDDAGDAAVVYRHDKSGKQIIRYTSSCLAPRYIYFYAVLDGIRVHDHASIPQGGPAFATYYSDNLASRREEESS
jgi:hypothetical protein